MKSLTQNKSLIFGILFIVFFFFIYNSFFKSDIVSLTINQSVRNIGADIVKTYSNLQSVDLDSQIFSSSTYLNLIDFTKEVPTQPIGRINPFDAI